MSKNVQVAAAISTAGREPYRWRWFAFGVVLLGSVMDLLDTLVTNVAGPTIRADLGGGTTLIQWLGAGYTLAMAAGLITGGRLGDIYGRKTMFMIGASGFTISSVLCSVSVSPGMLVAFRVTQGLSAAVMLPQGLGIIKEVFPPQEIAAAFGAFGPAMGLSSVAGPTVAGALIDANLFGTSWRMIFLINLPFGLLALAGAARFLPASRTPTATRLDPLGMVLAAVAALLLVYPVVQGRSLGWPAWTFASMAASVLVFAVFGWYEARKQRAGGEPLVTPGLFRKRAFSGGLVAGLSFFTAVVGFSLVFTVYVQIGLGYSPLKAGLAALPQALGSVAGFVASGVGLANKLGRKLIHIGTLFMAAGILGVYLTVREVGVGVSPWQLAPALVFSGIGLGLVLAPFFNIVLAGVDPRETGSASGTLTAVQQFGSALGLAVIGTIFFGLLGGHVASSTDTFAPALRSELTSAGVPATAASQLLTDLRACGHDRAVTNDPTTPPASCTRLSAATAAAARSSPDGARIGQAVAATGEQAARHGFSSALEETLWVVAGLQVLTCVLALLLPMHARPGDEEWGPVGGGERSPDGALAV